MTDGKAMFASDIHFPRQNDKHVKLFLKVMKAFKPDSIDLVGDLDDATSTSRWADGSTQEIVSIEDDGVSETRKFIKDIRDMLPNVEGHLYDGNHGWTRHSLYIDKKAPALLGVVTPDSLYEYSNVGFEWHTYQEPPVKRWDDMYVHHGESISKHAGESVRNDCLNWGISLIRGHSHRQGVYNKTFDMTGLRLKGYEIGHMSDVTKMDYTLGHDWQSGFAIAHIVNGYPHVQLIEIVDNSCVVDGKLFKV